MAGVSVVVPTYNRANLLRRAIESVLAQTYEDFELLIVDDGSTDCTEEVVRSFTDDRITYIKHSTNMGGSAARNTGIDRATGEYISFLDSDDAWVEQKLERQLTELELRGDEWQMAYCDVYEESNWEILSRIESKLPSKHESRSEGGKALLGEILSLNFDIGGASTLLVEKRVVDQLGGFDPSYQRHQDLEFLMRALKISKLAYVDEPLVMKYPTGSPSAAAVEASKIRLLSDFDEEISQLGERRQRVFDAHHYQLALYYFREGAFSRGITYLRNSWQPSPENLPELVWSIGTGFKAVAFDAVTG